MEQEQTSGNLGGGAQDMVSGDREPSVGPRNNDYEIMQQSRRYNISSDVTPYLQRLKVRPHLPTSVDCAGLKVQEICQFVCRLPT